MRRAERNYEMTTEWTKHDWFKVAPFALFFLLTLIFCPAIGSVSISLKEAFSQIGDVSKSLDASVLFRTRLPRILLASLTGAALAVAGAVFQALLRNPLADPFTLGVSSGGAMGAVIAIKLGLDISLLGFSTVPLFSFLGAAGAVALVYILAHSRGRLPTAILLLAGVSISFFFSAMILFAHYLADFTESHQMLRWLMGGLDIIGYKTIIKILPFWVLGVVLLFIKARDLDQLSFGSYVAWCRGVDVARSQKICYLAASLITASVVSLSGPIGFVGLIVPHSVRFLIGPSHRALLPASMFAGAGFLILCDTVARTVLAPTEIPVGVLTAMVGGPFFVALLFREKKKYAFEE